MTTTIKDNILNLSKAIRTPVLPEVKKIIDTVEPDYDGVELYKTDIKKWLSPIIDLTNYDVYPMNGITQGLDWWYHQEKRSVYMDEGDYQWISPKGNPYEECIKYQSWPSAIDGNFKKIHKGSLALDLAYVGSTKIKKIEIDRNVEHIFFSLSKPFGVRNLRTGWYFTKSRDQKLNDLTHSAKYYNYYAHEIAETIISNFDIDFVWNRLKDQQKDICNQMNFKPSNSVWLATTEDDEYKKFKRGKQARICLAGVYKL